MYAVRSIYGIPSYLPYLFPLNLCLHYGAVLPDIIFMYSWIFLTLVQYSRNASESDTFADKYI